MKRFSTWETVLLVWILALVGIVIAGQAQGQTINFPNCPPTCLPGGIGNPVKVMRAPFVPGASGYANGNPVPQVQWGPGAANIVTGQTWTDVICCTECAGGQGGRYPSLGPCDQHQGVSLIFANVAGAIVANNLLAASPACGKNNNGPLAQFYDARAWPPRFVGGVNIKVQSFLGFIGMDAYFVGGAPCSVVHIATSPNVSSPASCPTALQLDKLPTTDSQGRAWTDQGVSNGIQVAAGGPTPTLTPTGPTATPSPTSPPATPTATPSFVSTPTRTATLGPATATRTLTPTSALPPTATPGTCPAGMCFIVNACVPCQPPSTPAGGGTPITTFTPSRTPTPNCPVITVVVTATPHHTVRVVVPRVD